MMLTLIVILQILIKTKGELGEANRAASYRMTSITIFGIFFRDKPQSHFYTYATTVLLKAKF